MIWLYVGRLLDPLQAHLTLGENWPVGGLYSQVPVVVSGRHLPMDDSQYCPLGQTAGRHADPAPVPPSGDPAVHAWPGVVQASR